MIKEEEVEIVDDEVADTLEEDSPKAAPSILSSLRSAFSMPFLLGSSSSHLDTNVGVVPSLKKQNSKNTDLPIQPTHLSAAARGFVQDNNDATINDIITIRKLSSGEEIESRKTSNEKEKERPLSFTVTSPVNPKTKKFDDSLVAFIKGLCSTKSSNLNKRDAFLLTYRQYCSTSQFVISLIKQFEEPGKERDVRNELKVINLIKRWFDEGYAEIDLLDDPAAKEILTKFLSGPNCQAATEIKKVVASIQENLINSRHRPSNRGSFSGYDETSASSFPNKNEIRKSAMSKPQVPALQHMILLDFNIPHQIRETAIQLTLIEYNYFYKPIKARELLGQAWTKKDSKEILSPNVVQMINLYNKRIRWVTSEILRQGRTLKDRVDHVEAFIDIASICLSFGNFNTAFQIIQGLAAPSIRKLHAVWIRVNKDHVTRYEAAKVLSSGEKNAAKYRKELSKLNGKPCIPYLATVLKDLFNMEDSTPTKLPDGSINFPKFEPIHKTICDFLSHQFYSYTGTHFTVDEDGMRLQMLLSSALSRNMTDETLFEAAKKYENEVAENFLNSLGDVGFI